MVTAVAHSISNAGKAVVSTVSKLNKAMFGSTDVRKNIAVEIVLFVFVEIHHL